MKNKFESGDIVEHVKSGIKYTIFSTPSKERQLEYCRKPFYGYAEICGSIMWMRRQDEMEDGRFVLIKGNASCYDTTFNTRDFERRINNEKD